MRFSGNLRYFSLESVLLALLEVGMRHNASEVWRRRNVASKRCSFCSQAYFEMRFGTPVSVSSLQVFNFFVEKVALIYVWFEDVGACGRPRCPC
jgi:hypothetical protein